MRGCFCTEVPLVDSSEEGHSGETLLMPKSLIFLQVLFGLLIWALTMPSRGEVLITEFMAQNLRGMADENGDHPDWVELFNTGVEPVNVSGWFLTDDPQDLKQWRLPSTNLPPQKHLIVFLSGNDRAIPGLPLHASFRLGAGGDYLALVRPNGTTVESATQNPFPIQVPDISFGVPIRLENTVLIAEGSTARFLSPQNHFLDAIWRDIDTDDSAWDELKMGVGFEVNPNTPELSLVTDSVAEFSGIQGAGGWIYGYYNKSTDPNSSYQVADFTPFPHQGETYGVSNFWNGSVWRWAPINPLKTEIGPDLMRPNASNSTNHEHWPVRRWISTIQGTLSIDWTLKKIAVGGGGVTFRIVQKGVTIETVVLAGTNDTFTAKTLVLPSVSVGDPIDFLLSPVGVNNSTSDEADATRMTARIHALSSLDSSIATSVAERMVNKNASAWLRIPFVVENPALFERLILRLKYDDGFVAWINGVEVGHDNAPSVLTWDAAATMARPELEATTFKELDLTPRLGALRPGINLLAIQGLNVASTDNDFLLSAELIASRVILESGQFVYMSPPTPGSVNGTGNSQLGPVVLAVEHFPKEPKNGEALHVKAQVTRTFRDIDQITLKWRIMYSNEVSTVMFDDGAHEDGAAGDGWYGATIPWNSHTNGQMIRWSVTAADVDGRTNNYPSYTDPRNSPRYFGTVHHDVTLTNRLPVLHWFLPNPVGAADTSGGARSSFYYLGQFYDNVLVDLHGQSSASFPKHSYNVDFNRGYGFQYAPGSPRVDDVNLLTTWPDKAKMRNVLAYETHRDAGFAYHFVIPIRIQRNAQFFGDWHLVEDGDEEYLERVGLSPRGALYKMYDSFSGAGSAEKKTRKTELNSDLVELYRGATRSGAARGQFLYDNVDIPGMVNYLAIMILTANVDCCHKNYYAYRDTEGTREWKWLPWDQDLSFGRNWTAEKAYEEDRMFTDNGLRIGENNTLIGALFSDSKFLSMYNRRIRSLMDLLLQPTTTPPALRYYEKRIAELAFQAEPDAALDFKKWPTWGTKQTLAQAVTILTNTYLPGRRKYLYSQAGAGRTIPAAQSPTVELQFGDYDVTPLSGNSDEEYLVIRNPNTVAVDISTWRIEGDIDHRFIPGTVLPANGSLYLSPNVVSFRARSRNPRGGQALFVQGAYRGHLSARGGKVRLLDGSRLVTSLTLPSNPTPAQKFLRISELLFDPAPPPNGSPYAAEDFEFVELLNTGDIPLDLSRVGFADGIEFRFDSLNTNLYEVFHTNLVAGGTLILARNPAAFRSRYGLGIPIGGRYSGRLDNNGETLRIEDNGEMVLDFRYPTESHPLAHGKGRSIVLVDSRAAWNTMENPQLWMESETLHGTPGSYTSRYAFWAAQRFTAQELADPSLSGSDGDADADGDDNLMELSLGTDPKDAQSRFGLRSILVAGKPRLSFLATTGRTYTVQVREGVEKGSAWRKLQDVTGAATRTVEIPNPDEAESVVRFYRLITPALP